ncbi:dynein regulator [Ramicandelaber brevisporus]|nr:dynein regulator [Ramicandelaber brevisporus]KAI8871856.1 dynein regulator [Ramicandelaber brevisporus]
MDLQSPTTDVGGRLPSRAPSAVPTSAASSRAASRLHNGSISSGSYLSTPGTSTNVNGNATGSISGSSIGHRYTRSFASPHPDFRSGSNTPSSPAAASSSSFSAAQLARPVLTDNQRKDMHMAILTYLKLNKFDDTVTALKKQMGFGDDYEVDESSKFAGMLELKWTSVVRQQKKLLELQSKVTKLEADLETAKTMAPTGPGGRRPGGGRQSDMLPRAPQKFALTGHRMNVTRVRFHPLYTQVASASDDSTIKLWECESGECEKTLRGHTKSVTDVAWGPKGDWLVSCSSDMSVKIWDTSPDGDYQCLRTLFGHDHTVSGVIVFPGGERIASVSRDKSIKIWEFTTGYCTKTITGHAEWIKCIDVSEDGKLLITGSTDQSVRLWDPANGECKADMRGHDNVVESVMFVPTSAYPHVRQLLGIDPKNTAAIARLGNHPGQYVISGSRDKVIKLWETASGRCLHTFTGHDNWVRQIVFHPSGKFMLSASDDKTVRSWDLATGRCSKQLQAHDQFVSTLAFSSVFPRVATGSVDTEVKIWECR